MSTETTVSFAFAFSNSKLVLQKAPGDQRDAIPLVKFHNHLDLHPETHRHSTSDSISVLAIIIVMTMMPLNRADVFNADSYGNINEQLSTTGRRRGMLHEFYSTSWQTGN